MHKVFAYMIGYDPGNDTIYGEDESKNMLMYARSNTYKVAAYISPEYWNLVKDSANTANLKTYNRKDLHTTKAASQFIIDSQNYGGK